MRRFLLLPFATIVAMLFPAIAEADDADYCRALAGLATRYLVSGTAMGAGTIDLDTKAAIDNCNKGNTAAGIKVLEQKLRSGGFTLPKRS
jgi:hypothetical protein